MNRMKIAAAVASVALLVSGCTYGRDDASKENRSGNRRRSGQSSVDRRQRASEQKISP